MVCVADAEAVRACQEQMEEARVEREDKKRHELVVGRWRTLGERALPRLLCALCLFVRFSVCLFVYLETCTCNKRTNWVEYSGLVVAGGSKLMKIYFQKN